MEKAKYLDFTWMDVQRNAFAQFRMGVSQINDRRHRFSSTARYKACSFCTEEMGTEIHLLLQYPMYTHLTRRYLPGLANVHDTRSHFLSLISSQPQQAILSAAKFLVSAYDLRILKMAVARGL